MQVDGVHFFLRGTIVQSHHSTFNLYRQLEHTGGSAALPGIRDGQPTNLPV